MLIIERRLASGYVTFPVNDPKQLFRMLESGRTDVVVTSRVLGELTNAGSWDYGHLANAWGPGDGL